MSDQTGFSRDDGEGQTGSALAAALLMSLLLIAWTWSALSVSLSRCNLASTFHQRACASWMVDSGVNLALMEIQCNSTPRSEFREDIGPGYVEVQISSAPGRFYRVTANSVVGNVVQTRYAIIGLLDSGAYEWALFGDQHLDIRDAWIDSYDGLTGSYLDQLAVDPVDARQRPFVNFVGSGAHIGSNERVQLRNVAIRGDVALPPLITGDSAVVDGDGNGSGLTWDISLSEVSGSVDNLAVPVACPPLSSTQLNDIKDNHTNALATYAGGGSPLKDINLNPDSMGDRIDVRSGEVVLLPAGLYYLKDLKVNEGGTIRVTGPVQIWVEYKLDLNGGVIITESGSARDLVIFVGDFRRSEEGLAMELRRLVEDGIISLVPSGGVPIDMDGASAEDIVSSELVPVDTNPPEYVPGDYDGDGDIDESDYKYFLYYGDPGEEVYVARDYNLDGSVDTYDYLVYQDTLATTPTATDEASPTTDPGADYGLDYNDGVNPFPSDSDNFFLWNSVYLGWIPPDPDPDPVTGGEIGPAGEIWALKKGHIRMSHGGLFVGRIYAPTSTVCILSDADACGSIIAREVIISQGGAFHFDERLLGTPLSVGGKAFIKVVW